MRYAVGIDLGSTTTKAIVLDADAEHTHILGRGITNSRSNYDVACDVALTDALADTRFNLVDRELERAGLGADERAELLSALNRGFREEQYRRQLTELGATLRRLADEGGVSASESRAVSEIVTALGTAASELFRPGARRKSDFFRDLAGAQYMREAEARTRRHSCGDKADAGAGVAAGAKTQAGGGPSFDVLVGLFDKAMLVVENTGAGEEGFETCIGAAVERVPDAPRVLPVAIDAVLATPLEKVASVGTGYGRARLPFAEAQIRSEILCHGLGAHAMFPGTRTVLDIGGQDTKAIQVDEQGIVTSFQMNDRCAAGCGRYLGYIADELNLGLHELGPLASQSTRPARINSTCTVFAGAELRERLSLGEKRENILSGLHRAIILRAMSLLARSGGVRDEFTFTGGVANNQAAVEALRGLVRENYGEVTMNISPSSIYTGALGAALFALRGARREAAGSAA